MRQKRLPMGSLFYLIWLTLIGFLNIDKRDIYVPSVSYDVELGETEI